MIVALAIAVIAIVLGFFAVDTFQTAPETFVAIILLGLLAVILDAAVRRSQHHYPFTAPNWSRVAVTERLSVPVIPRLRVSRSDHPADAGR